MPSAKKIINALNSIINANGGKDLPVVFKTEDKIFPIYTVSTVPFSSKKDGEHRVIAFEFNNESSLKLLNDRISVQLDKDKCEIIFNVNRGQTK